MNIQDKIEYSEAGILSKQLITGKVELTLMCLGAGTTIGDHTSTKEGFVYVVEGDGIFNLEGEEISMKPGVVIPLKKNAVHNLKARKNTSILLALG